VPKEKEYLANCMKYKFHLKGVFAIPEFSQLFWHGICSALEYGQEIARILENVGTRNKNMNPYSLTNQLS
jgi:hypothetical protein